jgi:NAD(P)-dependent dehydrogenase (short-subunit alcohol dehydrogenase family)
MGQLAGNTTVVTGASTGIGLAAARRFAAEGAHVFVTGRRQEGAWVHQGVAYAQRQAETDRPICRVADVIALAQQREAS